MNCTLKARIIETNLDIIDINGFKYNLHLGEVGKLTGIKLLIPIFDDVLIGDVIKTEDWVLTRTPDSSTEYIDLCVRVDKFEVLTDDLTLSTHLISKVTGMFLTSEKCFLRELGPNKKPFYQATLKIRENGNEENPYSVVLVAFGQNAKKLSTVRKLSILKCEVTVKLRKSYEGYEFAVNEFEVMEGK